MLNTIRIRIRNSGPKEFVLHMTIIMCWSLLRYNIEIGFKMST